MMSHDESTSPFHAGEQQVQARLGVREQIEPWARKVVRDHLPAQHRDFYASLPYLVMAARDGEGRPWATLLTGEPGFVHSPDPGRLEIAALPGEGDPVGGALRAGAEIGLLGIELHTRRRNRVNGRVAAVGDRGISFDVDQAFGNCPQHIRERVWHREPRERSNTAVEHQRISPRLRQWIEGADTFFIATGHTEATAGSDGGEHDPTRGMDVSHRGGAPGFVRVEDDRTVVFGDYAGNNHFNTLGNLMLDERAGLLFLDFERGGLLQLSGRASVDWDAPAQGDFPGAQRLVRFELDAAVERPDAIGLRFRKPDAALRALTVTSVERESDDVSSFWLEPSDAEPLADFEAGQYLPLSLEVPGEPAAVERTYSLSAPPDGRRYRISVKREPLGIASRYLHDQVAPGATLHAGAPRGEFVLRSPPERPVVLIGAGVGVTPLAAMFQRLAEQPDGPPVFLLHGVRDGRHHPLAAELRSFAAASPRAHLHVAYSRPLPGDAEGVQYESRGRIDAAVVEKHVPGLDADFYLCGPSGFMAELQEALERRGVPAERIYSESFGPSSLAGGR